MVGCASREVFSDGSAPSVYQPPPPAQLSNYRCMSSSPSACFVNSSCLGVCPTGSYCSYTQRCSTNFMEGQYSCFRFNSTGGDCSMSYQDCAASCPIGSGCNYDQTCLSGTGTSPSGQPYRCRVGAPSNGNPGYNSRHKRSNLLPGSLRVRRARLLPPCACPRNGYRGRLRVLTSALSILPPRFKTATGSAAATRRVPTLTPPRRAAPEAALASHAATSRKPPASMSRTAPTDAPPAPAAPTTLRAAPAGWARLQATRAFTFRWG